ncbi:hypothetical protein CABS01_12200 [Colletotrichum abscissum]|uniref:uncharacterized protein n=1 Tax=Colletotrichum abscissum TaxID=1671311 RepID=UPI0027D59A85|nr:uncharacterized protein CABS01_12200 [Colletotrichum abscissum]KAK1491107.1 hypothetical protein CABS01_12200 [Colletotrichum abscissum]
MLIRHPKSSSCFTSNHHLSFQCHQLLIACGRRPKYPRSPPCSSVHAHCRNTYMLMLFSENWTVQSGQILDFPLMCPAFNNTSIGISLQGRRLPTAIRRQIAPQADRQCQSQLSRLLRNLIDRTKAKYHRYLTRSEVDSQMSISQG